MENNNKESALKVNEGVNQPPVVNPYIENFYQKNKFKTLSADEYIKGVLEGNRIILSQAITLIESSRADHRILSQKVLSALAPHAVKSRRIGITGVPGAGKSTFIEAFGEMLTSSGHKLAVLAIDPSSEKSKGSILGDKTRMERLANDSNAFIRPSPSAGSLGGVARKTREAIVLCEAAGFDYIFIETVGVGQSETAVHSMTDFFLLLMLSGAGDELQGIKRGIMEMSDLITITKADGNNKDKAELAKSLYINALHLFPPTESKWIPTAITTSSLNNEGLKEVLDKINDYFKLTEKNGYFKQKRREQSSYWMYETINEELKNKFFNCPEITSKLPFYEERVMNGEIGSFVAANELLNFYNSL